MECLRSCHACGHIIAEQEEFIEPYSSSPFCSTCTDPEDSSQTRPDVRRSILKFWSERSRSTVNLYNDKALNGTQRGWHSSEKYKRKFESSAIGLHWFRISSLNR